MIDTNKIEKIRTQESIPTPEDGFDGEVVTGIVSDSGKRLIAVKYPDGWYYSELSNKLNFKDEKLNVELKKEIKKALLSTQQGTRGGAGGGSGSFLPLSGGTMTGDITLPTDGKIIFDDADEYIKGDGTKLIVSSTGFIDFNASRVIGAARFQFQDGGSTVDIIRDEDDMSSDDSAALATQQSIKAYVDAVPTSIYSRVVLKVLPTQFVQNDDRGTVAVEDDTSNTLGIRSGHSTQEQYAFVKIPEGYKATHIQVLASASTSSAVTCKTYNYSTGATTDLETFDLNATTDITDVVASTTNDLVIKLTLASTTTIVYGARVTIAAV